MGSCHYNNLFVVTFMWPGITPDYYVIGGWDEDYLEENSKDRQVILDPGYSQSYFSGRSFSFEGRQSLYVPNSDVETILNMKTGGSFEMSDGRNVWCLRKAFGFGTDSDPTKRIVHAEKKSFLTTVRKYLHDLQNGK